ncbi:CopD family protein [Crenobacter sp. SG2305]|uniref:CopD family protein n=1 Tax=Crenobacter oryzisoli TaxID=3056844 RepID=UPI0025AB0A8E|nr:CopD family protein [Crenobacter sp. SG2305]MDN0083729.1 CopD family protein [Crenobacter sp. SG2305]
MSYPVLKALHICFVIAWFAGLFYLPRLYVNLAMAETSAERERLLLMSHKLYRFMTPLGALAVGFGLWLMVAFGFTGGWLHAKLTLVALLIGYHGWCGRLLKQFAAGQNRRSHRWYRVFNEAPVLVMFAVVFLVVLKPF